MNILVVDVGGTHVKVLATEQMEPRKFDSGPTMTAERMVQGVKELAKDWNYDVVTIGYPGVVFHSRPVSEPHNLGKGWVGFDSGVGGRRRRPAGCRTRTRRRGLGRRQRQETQGVATRLPSGRQRQCISRRLSRVGGIARGPTVDRGKPSFAADRIERKGT